MEDEIIRLVHKMINAYKTRGTTNAMKLSLRALQDHPTFPLFHRLHAMFIYESDHSKVSMASASALNAVMMNPCSLEFRYYYVALLFQQFRRKHSTIEKLMRIYDCENALNVDEPEETYWEYYRCLVDKKSQAFSVNKEQAVEFYKVSLLTIVESVCREVDGLSQNLLGAMFLSYDYNSPERMKITGDLINGDYPTCALVHRIHSKFCFEYAVRVHDDEERKRVLKQSWVSAKTAHKVFDISNDYLINYCIRTFQCSDRLSVNQLTEIKQKLINAFHSNYSIEPYYMGLIQEEFTGIIDTEEYYHNCIKSLLLFIITLEERCHLNIIYGDDNHKEFILIYWEYMEESDLKKFLEESGFFKENIMYLLNNIPKISNDDKDEDDLQTRKVITPEVSGIVGKIIAMYKQQGPSKAKTLTWNALMTYKSSSILLRLVSKYIYEADRSEIELALKYSKMAVLSCPGSLEHWFFHASLLFTKVAKTDPKDKMLYWEIIWECDKALNMKNRLLVENLPVLYIFDIYKTENINSEEEGVKYLKSLIVNLISMCFRAIDEIPQGVLYAIRDSNDIEENLISLNEMLNSKFRLCAFLHRLYSEFCFFYARETYEGCRMEWLAKAHISAKTAMETFRYSMEYRITYITRKLQACCFNRGQIELMKMNLEEDCLGAENNYEPYYKYLVRNNLTNNEEQRDYFKNCIRLLVAFLRLVVEVDQNIENVDSIHGQNMKLIRTEKNCKMYYQILDEYNLREFAEGTRFFHWDIKFLLENPPVVLQGKEVDKSEDLKEDSSEEQTNNKKKKKKKKKSKRKIKVNLEDEKHDVANVVQDLEDKESGVVDFDNEESDVVDLGDDPFNLTNKEVEAMDL